MELHLLLFIRVGTRRVIASARAANPDATWVAQQARNASMEMGELGLGAAHRLIDHDAKYCAVFEAVFDAQEVEVKRVCRGLQT